LARERPMWPVAPNIFFFQPVKLALHQMKRGIGQAYKPYELFGRVVRTGRVGGCGELDAGIARG
jgi:hypothetical protein